MSRYSDTGIAPMTDEERRLQMADLFVSIRPAWAGGDYTKAFHALQEILARIRAARVRGRQRAGRGRVGERRHRLARLRSQHTDPHPPSATPADLLYWRNHRRRAELICERTTAFRLRFGACGTLH